MLKENNSRWCFMFKKVLFRGREMCTFFCIYQMRLNKITIYVNHMLLCVAYILMQRNTQCFKKSLYSGHFWILKINSRVHVGRCEKCCSHEATSLTDFMHMQAAERLAAELKREKTKMTRAFFPPLNLFSGPVTHEWGQRERTQRGDRGGERGKKE